MAMDHVLLTRVDEASHDVKRDGDLGLAATDYTPAMSLLSETVDYGACMMSRGVLSRSVSCRTP